MYRIKLFTLLSLVTFAFSAHAEDESPILQPGAPGQVTKPISAEMATDIANSSYTVADVYFMQGMIVHHEQALTMSKLAKQRTNSKPILDLAGRIEGSQEDEIEFMTSWLKEREENTKYEMKSMGMHKMSGMASPLQLKNLTDSKSIDFDRLLLSSIMVLFFNPKYFAIFFPSLLSSYKEFENPTVYVSIFLFTSEA